MQPRFVRHPCARAAGALTLLAVVLAGCGREGPAPPRRMSLPVDVLADTARAGGATIRLTRTRPLVAPASDTASGARVWMARVSPSRPAAGEPPLPGVTRDSLDLPPPEPPMLEIDDGLKPPLPLTRMRLMLPRGVRPGVVELDVRVDETGAVSDVLQAGGSDDPALVVAATTCALAMRYRPAEQSGRRVAVWCRQRFDFTRGGAGPGPP